MIEVCHLKNVVIFMKTILRFVLSQKIINIYNDIAHKYGNVTVKGVRKYEKPGYKKNKLELDIEFLNICKQLGVYSKFFNCRMFLINMLYQFVNYSIVAPSTSVIKDSNIFHCFYYLYTHYHHLSLPLLDFLIISSHYNTPCNRLQ